MFLTPISIIMYTAGYYVIPGKPHDFMDTSPGSEFMNPNVLWGLHDNFNWLAEVSRVSVIPSPTNIPSKSPSTSPTSKPTIAPTTSPVLPGICSDDNNNDCSTTQDCECGQTPQRHFRELQAVCGGLKKKDCVSMELSLLFHYRNVQELSLIYRSSHRMVLLTVNGVLVYAFRPLYLLPHLLSPQRRRLVQLQRDSGMLLHSTYTK